MRVHRLIRLSLAIFAAALVAAPPATAATTASGGVQPPSGDQGSKPKPNPKPKPKSGDGKKGGKNRVRGASLRRLRTRPGKAFFDARRRARFEFELRGKRRRNIVITAVRTRDAAPVRTWSLRRVKPGSEPTIRWAGWSDNGRPAPQGSYEFVIANANGTAADMSRAEGEALVNFFGHKFPVRGEHTYGDGLGAGRDHRGFDIAADCGTPIVAARGGTVQWRKFQRGGAGHYVVIDGRRTKLDYVYMHLREKALVAEGDRVRTGQLIGYMGSTGRSTGCHLHFEVWSGPGWGEGGDFLDAERMAKRWDRYS